MTRQVALLDDVAAWLCAMVITAYVESGSKQALRILCKWIRVAYHLKELRSFNMFFAAMFGIQSLDTYETDEGTLLLDLIGELGEATGADAEQSAPHIGKNREDIDNHIIEFVVKRCSRTVQLAIWRSPLKREMLTPGSICSRVPGTPSQCRQRQQREARPFQTFAAAAGNSCNPRQEHQA